MWKTDSHAVIVFPKAIQSSFLSAQVCNSYFERPWEHCKTGRGTEHQLSHEQQINRVMLNLWVSKHTCTHTAEQAQGCLLFFAPKASTEHKEQRVFQIVVGFFCFLNFPIHHLKNIQGKKIFPCENPQWGYKPAEGFVQQSLPIQQLH